MRAFMPRYCEERKAAVLKKLLPPVNRTVVSVSAEEGISDVTLYSWLKHCRERGMPVPGNRKTGDDCGNCQPDLDSSLKINVHPPASARHTAGLAY